MAAEELHQLRPRYTHSPTELEKARGADEKECCIDVVLAVVSSEGVEQVADGKGHASRQHRFLLPISVLHGSELV